MPLQIENWSLDRLIPYARNPRRNDEAVDRMVGAIREFGFRIRRGRKRTIVAMGHKILRISFALLKRKEPYRDPGIDYEKLVVQRNGPRWLRALEKFGLITKLPVAA